MHLLNEKVELPAGRLWRRAQRPELLQMRAQPGELLSHVTALGKEGDLLGDALGLFEGDLGVDDLGEFLQGGRALRNEAYEQYAAVTKGEAQRRRWAIFSGLLI